ncbi:MULTISPECIES: haloacid dehalogenase type II [Pandoraea]|uniref:Type II haloacid dehalogenase n=1 Tax=Pandoraea communis TaxID=2508297 RepID=A0A5E4RPX4_9BURK|nr:MULTISPECIES: haloacid dehalogenase type II [Pandoraea]EON14685.1 type II haloacid dehalogenase [Pandoraea sp. SD6-2]MDM8355826.1 haloacid dehalogenase type II [Pandoraea communis]VVD64452.1 type II haloacid dehalogenase [Pandoraea communis]
MIDFEPKFITFDCYGTLVKFRMADMAREIYGDRLQGEAMDNFVKLFAAYRRDEVLGAWKPYRDVVVDSVRRTCERTGVTFKVEEAERFYLAVPTWGPHPDVPEGLSRLAKKYKLVGLTNAANEQIMSNIEKLGAPFHAVITAEEVGAYKPRMQGFEYMFKKLNVQPHEILHVSSSPRYDLMTAHDLGIKHKAMVLRGHEPEAPFYEYTPVKDIVDLAVQLGL